MNEKQIVKCPICGEPYYRYSWTENQEVCPDCRIKAEQKESRSQNQPPQI